MRAYFPIENSFLLGESLTWDDSDANLVISFFEILDKDGHIVNIPKPILLAKWKAYLLSNAQKGTTFKELPFIFEGSKGFELRSNSLSMLNRSFFIGSRLYFIGLSVRDPKFLDRYENVINMFRRLTKIERIIAMIDENTPPPLAQKPPSNPPPSDALELGINGAVRQIRDTLREAKSGEITVIQQIDFDKNGFKTSEVGFNEGYPDVITNWGWRRDDRINIQSAVNYPDRDGPKSGRRVDVSGFQTFSKTVVPEYGNRFETKFDTTNRPAERRRYTNTGALVSVEQYRYSKGVQEIKTVDDTGGFLNSTRQRLDARNNLIETQTLDAGGRIFESMRFEYEFDSHGNWIEKRILKTHMGRVKTKSGELVHRDIIYYQLTDLWQVS